MANPQQEEFSVASLKDSFDVFPEVKDLLLRLDNIPEKTHMDAEEAASILCADLEYLLTADTLDQYISDHINFLKYTASSYSSEGNDYEDFDEEKLYEGLKAIFEQTIYAQRKTTPVPIAKNITRIDS